MDLIQFSIEDGLFPLYRSVAPEEASIFLTLLGEDFLFPVAEGDPVDDLLFDVLVGRGVDSHLFFRPPPTARVLGTFLLQHGLASPAADEQSTARSH